MKNTVTKDRYTLGLFLVAAILVCLVRFNGNQFFVQQEPYDAKYFNAYVNFFRGETIVVPIRPISNWRLLLPLVASFLPFSAATSLNLVNLFCVIGTLLIIRKTFSDLQISTQNQWFALGLYIFSFPTFYYSCISYVDPGSIFFLAIGIYSVLKNNGLLLTFAMVFGLLAKETIVLLIPFAFTYAVLNRNWKQAILVILLFGLYFLEYHAIKLYAPLSANENQFKSWQISNQAAWNNLARWHTGASFILSFGLIGFLVFYQLFHSKKLILTNTLAIASLTGILSTFALYAYSYITTVADGRIIWHAYFFFLLLIFDPKLMGPPTKLWTSKQQ